MKTQTLFPLGYRGLLIGGATVAFFASFVMLAQADVAPTVVATPHSATTNAVVTSANIGSGVYTTVQVASTSATTSPTGTVTFNRYNNTSCSGAPIVHSGISLVNGAATSSTAIMTGDGLSFKVHYNGQAGVYSANDSACMPVVAEAPSTGLGSSLSSNTVLAGSSVTQSTTLTNATSNAGGQVSYVVYTDFNCSNAWVGAGVRTVTNGNVPSSDAITFNNAGNYYWKAIYSGDAHNAQATSSCLSLTVLATSSTPTTTAAISGVVYNDLDKDYVKDAGEAGIAGFTVNLYNAYNANSGKKNVTPFKTTQTDANGMYSFTELADGKYSVELINKSGWHQNTGDYHKLNIKNGVALTNIDFANSSSTSQGTGDGKANGRGKGNNGNHFGWFKFWDRFGSFPWGQSR